MPPSFLTREGYQKLQEELDYLRTVKRQEVAERLHEAMEGGELIEDAEYEAAKNEQAFVEGRIQELEILLANARMARASLKSTLSLGRLRPTRAMGASPTNRPWVVP
jgi:transcription elongation GreA/GreB family factor